MPSVSAPIPTVDDSLLDELTAIVARAAAAILAIAPAGLTPRMKADHSPVTAADQAAEAVILESLARLLPGLPVVSEEAAARGEACAAAATLALVDPLDGTREIIEGRSEYTVNVAIVADRVPVLGLVAAPALGLLWRGVVGRGAERLRLVGPSRQAVDSTPIRTRRAPSHGLVAAVSRSHFDANTASFVDRLPIAERIVCGSALKFCRIAEGAADVYPRLSPTCEWDVAAGHAVIAAAGGMVTTPAGGPILYGREGFRIPGFIAWGDAEAARSYAG
jgi:3'(2'), 5'-bisphosphate nucleotidase